MNNKGFAITGILYTLLLIAIVSLNLLLYNLLNKKNILDQIKMDAVSAIEKDSNFDYLLNLINSKVDKSEIYPVGSIYKSTSDVDPSKLFGGTWSKIYEGNEINQIGSQVIYADTLSGSGPVTKTNLIGGYEWYILDSLFLNTTIPTGYHKEFRLTLQGNTDSNNTIHVSLNNVEVTLQSWSYDSFRVIRSSPFFKLSDIIMEPVMNYPTRLGTNLQYSVDGNGTWNIFNITIQAFIVSDDKFYTWKRIK